MRLYHRSELELDPAAAIDDRWLRALCIDLLGRPPLIVFVLLFHLHQNQKESLFPRTAVFRVQL